MELLHSKKIQKLENFDEDFSDYIFVFCKEDDYMWAADGRNIIDESKYWPELDLKYSDNSMFFYWPNNSSTYQRDGILQAFGVVKLGSEPEEYILTIKVEEKFHILAKQDLSFTSRADACEACEKWFNKNIFKDNIKDLTNDFFESKNGSVFNEDLIKLKDTNNDEFELDTEKIIGKDKSKYEWWHIGFDVTGTAEYVDSKLDKTYYMLYSNRYLHSFKEDGLFINGLVIANDSEYDAKIEIINYHSTNGAAKTALLKSNIKNRLEAAKFIEKWFDKNIFDVKAKILTNDFFESLASSKVVQISDPYTTESYKFNLDDVYSLNKNEYRWHAGNVFSQSYEELDKQVSNDYGASYAPNRPTGLYIGQIDLHGLVYSTAYSITDSADDEWFVTLYIDYAGPKPSKAFTLAVCKTRLEGMEYLEKWFDKYIFNKKDTDILTNDFFESLYN